MNQRKNFNIVWWKKGILEVFANLGVVFSKKRAFFVNKINKKTWLKKKKEFFFPLSAIIPQLAYAFLLSFIISLFSIEIKLITTDLGIIIFSKYWNRMLEAVAGLE